MHATRLKTLPLAIVGLGSLFALLQWAGPALAEKPNRKGPFNVVVPKISTDATIQYDYDIVYIRTPRKGNAPHSSRWPDASLPLNVDEGGDLMLLHPDGREERLVAGGKGSVTDPFVSFDAQWVYYSQFEDLKDRKAHGGGAAADIYKIHVKTRKVVRLTHQEFTPNTGAAQWAKDDRTPEPGKTTKPYPICNLGPCPVPGGKVMFTSNRNGFEMPRGNNMGFNIPFQLFVMDDDGSNVEMIGHLNIASALHPVILKDGRVMFSSLEDQGFRNDLDWALWTIHPDGTQWAPLVSAYGGSAFHFHTQLSNEDIVTNFYYGGKNEGFGTFVKLPLHAPPGTPAFGPGDRNDPRNGREIADVGLHGFRPYKMEALTRFARGGDWAALSSVPGKDDAPRMGKVTHPSGAPDNHLLCTYSPGNAHFHSAHTVKRPGETLLDAGLYLIKSGDPIDEPAQMFVIKNDPNFNEQWPRALVPYKRIYGVEEPPILKPLANDGKLRPELPEGTPFGLVGTSSLYKRETFPNGTVRPGEVTGSWAGKEKVPFRNWEDGNWVSQGADAGLYSNDQVHAIRILAMEPTTARRNGPKAGRQFYSHARERLRILAEIPVRKFNDGKQPTDPDGNPDTSFLAKIPADVPFTFQTLDKDGMVLNMAQTWHQVRPGEVRNDCGGCHAHSQKPTLFNDTAAAKPNYKVFDTIAQTPLLTTRQNDQSGKQWDIKGETGLRFEKGARDVEFFRDVKPILDRSCIACHSHKLEKPAGNLVLDDDQMRGEHISQRVPGTYYRLASDPRALFGHKPPEGSTWGEALRKSRYIWAFQSRRSLLVWKIFGARLDGFTNDDHPMEAVPGDPSTLKLKGEPFTRTPNNRLHADVGYTGSVMPPPAAVAGTYAGPDGQKIKVAPLSDEDRLTLVRWIDLGCPLDLDHDPARPKERGFGWMLDDTRPTLTLTHPKAGPNPPLTRILVGMHDYYSGLDADTFEVRADFAIDGAPAGQNLAAKFKPKSLGVWEWALDKPLTDLPKGKLTVAVKDRQGNVTRIERTFRIAKPGADTPAAKPAPEEIPVEREKLSLAGWDPDEPVPALLYYRKGQKAMPVVIFCHGLGGNKEQYPERMREMARKGLFVVTIDAHLHGERKVPGIFPEGKNLGKLGNDYSIWIHQSAISHTSRDVSKIIDALSARSDVDTSRVGVAGVSMGGCTCMVSAWRDRRVSVVASLIGAVDHWYDVTKTPPGPEQDARRKALSPRVRQLVDSLNPQDHKTAYAPKALFLANGGRDDGIDIESIRKFVKDLQPSYAAHPDRLKSLEEPETGHALTEKMWSEGIQWLVHHLVERPIDSKR